jgi:hypothetical protein
MSETITALKNRSVVTPKMAHAMTRAMEGPSWPIGGSLFFRISTFQGPEDVYFLPQHSSMPTVVSLLSTPATALRAISVTPVSV